MQQFDKHFPTQPPTSVPLRDDVERHHPTTVPKYDVLRRDRLPNHQLDLEIRTTPFEKRAVRWTVILICGEIFALHVLTVLTSITGRVFGRILESPLVLALALAGGLLSGFRELSRRLRGESRLEEGMEPDGDGEDPTLMESFHDSLMTGAVLGPLQIVGCFYLPLFLPVFLVNAQSRDVVAHFSAVAFAFALVTLTADAFATHYIHYVTANFKLPADAVERRREWWKLRLTPWKMKAAVAKLTEQADALERERAPEAAGIIRQQISEKAVVREYWLGLVVLILAGWISALVPARLSSLVFVGLCAIWAYRRPAFMLSPTTFAENVLWSACRTWILTNLWDHPLSSGTPGVFRSPIGTTRERMFLVGIACFCIGLLFVPYPFEWGIDYLGSVRGVFLDSLDEAYMAFLPLAFFIGAVLALAGPSLSVYYEAIEATNGFETLARSAWSEWRCIAQRLAESADPFNRDHFFYGYQSEVGNPVIAPREVLCHGQISGPTGRGKSSIGVVQMIIQQIMRGDGPVFVILYKEDPALFHQLRDLSAQLGRKFRHFTNELHLSTHLFNPFSELNVDQVSIRQRAETFLDALRLNYGDKYGAKFFSSQSRDTMHNIFERNPNITSFEEAYANTSREFFEKDIDRDRVKELISVLRQLASVEPLNWTTKSGYSKAAMDAAIFMPRAIDDNEIICFVLPGTGESATVKEIGSLVIYSLLTAANLRYRRMGLTKKIFLMVDEFQVLANASTACEVLLQMSRSLGIHLIVSNQTLTDLKKTSPALLNSLLNNTRLRMHFSPNDPDMEDYLINQSGEALYWNYARYPYTCKTDKRLSRNDLKAATSKPLSALLQIPVDAGYACYGGHLFSVQLMHHLTKEEYDELSSRPWPAQTDETIVPKERPRVTSQERAETRLIKTTAGPDLREGPTARSESRVESPWRERLLKAYETRMAGGGQANEGDIPCEA